MKQTSEDLKLNLGKFIGTENYYLHWSRIIKWTDGIQYLCEEAGAFWFMDLVASHFIYEKVKNAPFQLWRIEVKPDKSAIVSMKEDTGKPNLVYQEVPYTDFPLKEFEFYCIDGICLLKSEY
jgi:hypothetical protein